MHTAEVKSLHASWEKLNVGPLGFFESRTSTVSGTFVAHSTHSLLGEPL